MTERATRLLARYAARAGVYPHLRIAAGEGRGLRISMRNASGDYLVGTNELPVQQALVSLLRPGAVCYDIGANIGFFSIIAARAVGPAGHVYAFEPLPANADCVRANARVNGLHNVTVVAAAVSDADGEADFFVATHPGGGTLSAADAPADASGAVAVPLLTIDSFASRGGVRPPDVIKVDVEGAEWEALAGMAGVLADRHPALVVEVDGATREVLDDKLDRLHQQLREAGYETRTLDSAYPGMAWQVGHIAATPAR